MLPHVSSLEESTQPSLWGPRGCAPSPPSLSSAAAVCPGEPASCLTSHIFRIPWLHFGCPPRPMHPDLHLLELILEGRRPPPSVSLKSVASLQHRRRVTSLLGPLMWPASSFAHHAHPLPAHSPACGVHVRVSVMSPTPDSHRMPTVCTTVQRGDTTRRGISAVSLDSTRLLPETAP